MHMCRGINGVEHVARCGVGGIWVPWICVDLEIGEGHRGHLSGEEAQVIVDYVEVLKRL